MRLSIPEPCHENWNEMTVTEQGKFCGSCQTEVVDFSSMTKAEIKEFFINKATANTCGRFQTRQLQEINCPDQGKRICSKPWWIAAATIFIFAKQGFSQGKPYVENRPKIEINNAPISTEAPTKKQSSEDELLGVAKDSLITVSGYILGEQGDTLPFVNIQIVGSKLGTVTDINGKFKLSIPLEHRDSLLLRFSYVGYKRKEQSYVKLTKSIELGKVILSESEVHLLGGVHYEPSVKDKVRSFFRRLIH